MSHALRPARRSQPATTAAKAARPNFCGSERPRGREGCRTPPSLRGDARSGCRFGALRAAWGPTEESQRER